MFAYLPKLLTSVHDLDKPDAAARAAGFALVAVIARPIGGWLADRIGADTDPARLLRRDRHAAPPRSRRSTTRWCPSPILALSMAAAFGLGTGAVFKLVAHDFPDAVGAVTGVVGAAGGLGGFFPPLVMAFVKSATGDYLLGFALPRPHGDRRPGGAADHEPHRGARRGGRRRPARAGVAQA